MRLLRLTAPGNLLSFHSPTRMMKKTAAAFTLIELLVVISIIAVLAGAGGPCPNQCADQRPDDRHDEQRASALSRRISNGDGWGDEFRSELIRGLGKVIPPRRPAWHEYCTKLVQNDYLKPGDLQKILNAPGASCVVTPAPAMPAIGRRFADKSALKVYKVKDTDASNTIFAVSANYIYATRSDHDRRALW